MKNKLNLDSVEWNVFKLGDIFNIENCKCSNSSKLKSGHVPYVGATNRNNGVLSFVNFDENLITKGNCIAFICQGEGSVGYAVYKYEDFIGSTSIKVGRNINLNKYNALFITTISDTIRFKYNFGYNRNDMRLKRETLNLPIDETGKPNWQFMEDYIKQEQRVQYQKIIDYYKKCQEE